MAAMDEIGQEKQRISERFARLDADRTKLGVQLNELEIVERGADNIRRKSRCHREAEERTPGDSWASYRW